MTPEVGRKPVDEDAVLRVVAAFVRETHPSADIRVTPGAALDADLGLDSLARVELLHRLEDAFGVEFPSSVQVEAGTTEDLLRALRAAHGVAPVTVTEPRASGPAALEGVPGSARTLVEVLDWHVARHPDRTHVTFYPTPATTEDLTYAALSARARGMAAGLAARGITTGDTVAIMLPTCLEFFACFYGVLLAGAIPVPIYPPARLAQIEDHLLRQAAILANAGTRLLVTVEQGRGAAGLVRGRVATLEAVVTPDELASGATWFRPARLAPDDTAFIQYTSGSTGTPKGVVLSHANLLANIRAWGTAVDLASTDVCVSWLPLYHDMGLIGTWLGSLYHGGLLVLMSPVDFLARPERWLQAIHHHRGTVTAAPNFAFELCLRRIPDERLEGLDLSSWRLAANGAEPVSADTIERFTARFARCGFRADALAPVYGLAECTVGLAVPPLGRLPPIDRVQRAALAERGLALPAGPDDVHALRVVACGRALPGHRIRVVDDADCEVGDRVVGHVQFQGPSSTRGYFGNPGETAKLFHGAWLDTGDIGYLVAGDLHLTSRAKDMIIRGGHNLYPYELEEAVGNLAGIRKGCVAVMGVPDAQAGTERIVVLAERRGQPGAGDADLRQAITRLALELLGSPPDDVVLAEPGSVLKTSSGKIRRGATRERYLAGSTAAATGSGRRQVARLALAALPARVRRLAATLASALFAARAWGLFVLLAPLAWVVALAARSPAQAWTGDRAIARLWFMLAGIPIDVTGREHLPASGGCVLVANHASYLDAIALVASLPRHHCFVAKREFLDAWVSRRYFEALGAAFVERFDIVRGLDDVQRVSGRAAAGERLVIFPEGTFTPQTGLRPFHMGAFVIAARLGLPVVPVALAGTRSILRDASWWPRRGRIAIAFGAPITPSGTHWTAAVGLRDQARAQVLAGCGEGDLAG